jgi:hypothetical protein
MTRCYSDRREGLSSSSDIHDYRYVLQTSQSAMTSRLSVHRRREDRLLVLRAFPFRYGGFLEVKDPFCLSRLGVLSQTAYCVVRESTSSFQLLVFLWRIFHFGQIVSVTQNERVDRSPSNKTGIFGFILQVCI